MKFIYNVISLVLIVTLLLMCLVLLRRISLDTNRIANTLDSWDVQLK